MGRQAPGGIRRQEGGDFAVLEDIRGKLEYTADQYSRADEVADFSFER